MDNKAGVMQPIKRVLDAIEKLQFVKAQPNVTVTSVDTAPFAKKLTAIQDDVAAELKVQDLLQMIRATAPGAK
jgi:hypothetical protein